MTDNTIIKAAKYVYNKLHASNTDVTTVFHTKKGAVIKVTPTSSMGSNADWDGIDNFIINNSKDEMPRTFATITDIANYILQF
jgi:hypothetical protein